MTPLCGLEPVSCLLASGFPAVKWGKALECLTRGEINWPTNQLEEDDLLDKWELLWFTVFLVLLLFTHNLDVISKSNTALTSQTSTLRTVLGLFTLKVAYR